MRGRIVGSLCLTLLAVVVPASPADAHAGDASGPTNFETIVKDIEPDVDGLRVRSVDLSNGIELRNRTGETVIVYGYEDEPYLLIDNRGVFENERSPATYLNASREGDGDIPDSADPEAKPKWRRVSGGDTVQWHDHRAHWMSSNDPPAVRADPTKTHVVLPDWVIPISVDGERVSVTGDLTWTPGPAAWPYWTAAAALAALLFGIAFVAGRWRRAVFAAVLVLTVAVSLAQSVGYTLAPDMSGDPLARLVGTGPLLVFTWFGGLIAAWWVRGRRAPEAVVLAGIAGLALFVSGGIADSSSFARAHVGFGWGDELGRWAAAAALGFGGAVTLIAAMAAWRRWFGEMATG
jgi:hypothetical protein